MIEGNRGVGEGEGEVGRVYGVVYGGFGELRG